jgi:hypothetical protein
MAQVVPSHILKLCLFPHCIIGPEKVPGVNLASALRDKDIPRQAPDLSFPLQYSEDSLIDRNSPLLLILGMQDCDGAAFQINLTPPERKHLILPHTRVQGKDNKVVK